MKVSDYIAETLAVKEVPAVFELVGGMITHLLDSIHTRGVTPIISMRHEQGAAFAAEGCSRLSRVPAVAMATSGPGATNLLTGIGSCFFDSTPAVFITGQVNRSEQKGQRLVRQLGFQETDIISMAAPVCKRVWRVDDESKIPSVLDEAFMIAVSRRPGPVLVDIPMDVQRADVTGTPKATIRQLWPSVIPNRHALALKDALLKSKRPIILAGGGIRSSHTSDAFRKFVDATKIPAVHSLMGVDALPYHHPLNAGMIGSYGNRWSNLALSKSDCLIVLGSRLDIRQTGANTGAFKGGRPIFHIDCDESEVNNRIQNCTAIISDLNPAFETLTGLLEPFGEKISKQTAEWRDEIAALRSQWPDTEELRGQPGINPNVFMHQLSRATPSAAAYVSDVGQHQMWAAQSLEIGDDQRMITSGGMGSMGFGLPAAIGCAIASPGRPVVVIAGDGGFQCNIQELQTIAHLGLPVKIVVINNECHGMVRQFQESYFEGRYQSTMWGYSAPNFESIGKAYGIPSFTVSEPGKVERALAAFMEDPNGPALLQVMIPPTTNAYPKLAFGHSMESMEPFVKSLDMEAT